MKQIILNENQFKGFLNMHIIAPGLHEKRYPVNPAKVLIIKKYLDDGFRRGQMEELGPDGFPCITPMFGQIKNAEETYQDLNQEDMLDLMMAKYKNLCAEKEETERLIKRILEDWYNNKITPLGGLSVNYV